PDNASEDRVVFIDGDKLDPISFKLETVTLLLINLEEETTLRAADPYFRSTPDGSVLKTYPDIRLNLYVLFVAKFKQYENSLACVSDIIQFFQSNKVLTQQNFPALSDKIERLTLELITPTFNEQNEIWNALRTTYHPSVLYKVKMLVYTDKEAIPTPLISSTDISVAKITK
ncbi:MAG: DUF4255 domain-containing protein, partial [Candidatus Electrothrix sp. AR1]|nr:DUF4255 domain-containing protein [Candidatus Electrothrix sp. AR1]